MSTMYDGLLTDGQVAQRIGRSKSSVWRYTTSVPGFPQPVKMGLRDTRFKEAEVDAWIAKVRQEAGIDTQVDAEERREVKVA